MDTAVTLSKEQVKVIFSRIESAVAYKKKHWYPMAKEAYQYYKGNVAQQSMKHFNFQSSANFVRPNTEIIVTSIGGGDVEWDVIANDKYCVEREGLNTAILNRVWKDIGADDEIILPLRDSKIFSHGAVAIGWKVETKDEMVLHSRDLKEVTSAEHLADQINAKIGNPDASQTPLSIEEVQRLAGKEVGPESEKEIAPSKIDEIAEIDSQKGEEVGDEDATILYDNIWIERIHPGDIVWDTECHSPICKDAEWMARRLYIPIPQLKKMSQWDVSVINQIKGTFTSSMSNFSDTKQDDSSSDLPGSGRQVRSHEQDNSEDERRAVVWEYEEKARGIRVVISEEVPDECLWCGELNYFFSGGGRVNPFSYEILPDNVIPEVQYGDSSAYQMVGFQQEITYDRTIKEEYKRRFLPQYTGSKEDFASDEAIDAFNNPELARLIDTNKPPQALVNPPLPGDFWLADQQVNSDMAFVTGVNEIRKGELSSTRRTKFEIKEVLEEGSSRSDFATKQYIKFLERIGYKIHRILADKEFGIPKRMVKVWNPEIQQYEFQEYDSSHCEGEWDFEVTAGAAIHRDATVDRQMTKELIEILIPFAQQGQADISPLIEKLVKSYPIVKNVSDIVPPKNLPFNQATIALVQKLVIATLTQIAQQGQQEQDPRQMMQDNQPQQNGNLAPV